MNQKMRISVIKFLEVKRKQGVRAYTTFDRVLVNPNKIKIKVRK